MTKTVAVRTMAARRRAKIIMAVALVPLLLLSLGWTRVKEKELGPDDKAKIKAVIEAYRTSWLEGDAEGVMKTLAEDATLLPHHGVTPVRGSAAIRKFWWPADSPPTKITKFTMEIQEIGGRAGVAYAWGKFALSYSWKESDGREKSFSNAGTQLMVLRQQADGSWRITHHMWDDPPPQAQQE